MLLKPEIIDPLHNPVTWYGIHYTGMQVTQWDFQNKGKSGWTDTSFLVLEVSLCNLRPSIIYSVPCDRIVQRAYYQPNGPLGSYSDWTFFLTLCNYTD